MVDEGSFSYEGAELVLGLVAPVGTDLDKFVEMLDTQLQKYRYRSNTIRLSDLAASFQYDGKTVGRKGEPEHERIRRLMDDGNHVRMLRPDFLAHAAAAQINQTRGAAHAEPLARQAHVLRSLKHPGEVQALRRIYGPGFFLVGVLASQAQRTAFLEKRKGCSRTQIRELFERDEDEVGVTSGQRTRDTFHLADAFISVDDDAGLVRFLDLIFGHPHETPTCDEYAMFLAFSAALRSADLSRQVGAVVMSSKGDVLSVGANDVPTAGGGLCWPGPDDDRDRVRGHDENERQRTAIIDEVLERLCPPGINPETWRAQGWRQLKNAGLMGITEYGRAVHAEMEALLSCARVGVSPRGATLFSTTFPCHNCAKHIIAAGIQRIVYVEPYPKSLAASMYPKLIKLGGAPAKGSVLFEPFHGIGPRRFFDLFSVGLSTGYPVKRKQDGKARKWKRDDADVRVPLLPNSYIEREQRAAQVIFNASLPQEPRK